MSEMARHSKYAKRDGDVAETPDFEWCKRHKICFRSNNPGGCPNGDTCHYDHICRWCMFLKKGRQNHSAAGKCPYATQEFKRNRWDRGDEDEEEEEGDDYEEDDFDYESENRDLKMRVREVEGELKIKTEELELARQMTQLNLDKHNLALEQVKVDYKKKEIKLKDIEQELINKEKRLQAAYRLQVEELTKERKVWQKDIDSLKQQNSDLKKQLAGKQ